MDHIRGKQLPSCSKLSPVRDRGIRTLVLYGRKRCALQGCAMDRLGMHPFHLNRNELPEPEHLQQDFPCGCLHHPIGLRPQHDMASNWRFQDVRVPRQLILIGNVQRDWCATCLELDAFLLHHSRHLGRFRGFWTYLGRD